MLLAISLSSCLYEDFITDYSYSAVYFGRATNTRNFVIGETHQIKLGIVLGGRIENTKEEWADFRIDPSLVPEGMFLLPSNYYTLSHPSRMIIEKGRFQGDITISVDTAAFVNDPLVLQGKYVLPFRIVETSVDTILPNQSTHIMTVRYEHRLFGNYYHNGILSTVSQGGDTTHLRYHQKEPVTNDINNWELVTIGPYTLRTNGLAQLKGGNNSFYIKVKPDNSVELQSNPSSTIIFTNSKGVYNPQKREFYLDYSYISGANTLLVKDTLIFRNRILDGVNQWR
jgi:hypothetical protein